MEWSWWWSNLNRISLATNVDEFAVCADATSSLNIIYTILREIMEFAESECWSWIIDSDNSVFICLLGCEVANFEGCCASVEELTVSIEIDSGKDGKAGWLHVELDWWGNKSCKLFIIVCLEGKGFVEDEFMIKVVFSWLDKQMGACRSLFESFFECCVVAAFANGCLLYTSPSPRD